MENKKRYTRLTLAERKSIEEGVGSGTSLCMLAERLGRNVSTVSRELFRNAVHERKGAFGQPFNDCAARIGCTASALCAKPGCRRRRCAGCPMCHSLCPAYSRETCARLALPPYVCNGCPRRTKCTLEKAVYRAAKADRAARELFSYSHSGVSLTPDELGRLDALVTPLIKNGQSPWHICETHRAEAMVCDKTLYRYIQDGLIGARSTDLTRKVSMRPRRTTRRAAKVERRCRDGRALGDYNAWLAANPDVEVPQADTVYGAEGRGHKCLMTVCFPASGLLLAYIRDANTAATANAAFARIAEGLGAETFAALFPAILTDNGPEFSNPTAIERPLPGGAMLTRVFYCDPMASWQKPSVENSHLMLRRIFPKGASMDAFSQRDVAVALSHINSYARRALGGQTPIDVFAAAHGTALLETAGITRVMPDDIMMRPSLIGR